MRDKIGHMKTDMEQESNAVTVTPDRWTLIRDVGVFQVKLLLDGFRDLLLMPISLVTALISLLRAGGESGTEFYDLLDAGRRSESWINLFGAAERVHGPATADEGFAADDIDELVSKVEAFVIDEYRSGGATAQAKERLDKALDKLAKRARSR